VDRHRQTWTDRDRHGKMWMDKDDDDRHGRKRA